VAYEWDPTKRVKNLSVHGVDFEDVERDFDWSTATVEEDTRHNYGERRWRAVGVLHGRVHVIIVTRRGPNIRLISARKASRKEVGEYEQTQQQQPGVAKR
jgi:uncharacterized protein